MIFVVVSGPGMTVLPHCYYTPAFFQQPVSQTRHLTIWDLGEIFGLEKLESKTPLNKVLQFRTFLLHFPLRSFPSSRAGEVIVWSVRYLKIKIWCEVDPGSSVTCMCCCKLRPSSPFMIKILHLRLNIGRGVDSLKCK